MATLFIYPKQGDSSSVALKGENVSIGRSPDNVIPISDPFCSGHHAVVVPTERGYAIMDCGSKNGTYVNGKKIAGTQDLHEGDEILIGSVRILFDKAMVTDVEVTDVPTPQTNLNAAIPFKEILAKPTSRAAVPLSEADRFQAENKIYSVLSEVSQALVLHKPLSELLDHIMDLISGHLRMDRGVLMLKEGNPVQLVPKVIRVNAKSLQNKKIQVSRSIMTMAVDEHLAVLTSDAAADPRFQERESIITSGIHSAVCVPLWNNREVIGLIYADRISLVQEFTEDDLRLLTLLANLAAVKIENAGLIEKAIEKEKLERELVLAARIQEDFLPKANPSCENFDIAGRNLPCHQVGGDYYDFISVDPCRIGIAVADVSGKGVSASLLMASLRAALRSDVEPECRLPDMAAKLNDFVEQSSPINAFITFFYGDLNKGTGEMTYINAGHNPPLVLDRTGSVRTLETSGLCLGMFPGSSYLAHTQILSPGDILVVFTDGITESRNGDGEEFGGDRLAEICRENQGASAADLIARVFGGLETFTADAPPADDRTLVVIKRLS